MSIDPEIREAWYAALDEIIEGIATCDICGSADDHDHPEEWDQIAYIPDDGKIHPCACGVGSYTVWDCDGYAPPAVMDDNSDGGYAISCDECGREFAVAPKGS
jgi:hypothetical protein